MYSTILDFELSQMTIHRVKLKDLNQAYIERLQKEGGNGEQEVTIWVSQKSTALTETQFWAIIDLLDWKAQKQADILVPAINKLSELSKEQIESFHDILSEKLYLIDGQPYAEEIGTHAYKGANDPFSADGFLYARCMAVAQGEHLYNAIVKDPTNMIKEDTFEALLRLPALAFEQKTGQAFEHLPAYLIETFSNPEGWDGHDLLSKILS